MTGEECESGGHAITRCKRDTSSSANFGAVCRYSAFFGEALDASSAGQRGKAWAAQISEDELASDCAAESEPVASSVPLAQAQVVQGAA